MHPNLALPWWTFDKTKDYRRGRLVRAFLPHVDQIPNQLIPIGRRDPTDHQSAYYEITPLRVSQSKMAAKIPVAALPEFPGEVKVVYRAKKRPAIILSEGGPDIPKHLIRGSPKWQTNPVVLVAPYYGVDRGKGRAGFNEKFVEKIRRCRYPNFMWDILPVTGAEESILRLDHIQPIGKHHDSLDLTDYCLSQDAIDLIDEWLNWLIFNYLPENSILYDIRESLVNDIA